MAPKSIRAIREIRGSEPVSPFGLTVRQWVEMGGKGLVADAATYEGIRSSVQEVQAGEAKSEAVPPITAPNDPDLTRIIAAWPRLHEKVKAAIRAMVESAD